MIITTPIFKGTVSNGSTQYVGLPIRGGALGAHIAWKDATSAATITLELSSFNHTDAPVNEAGDAWEWEDVSASVPITGPAASAAGSAVVNVENVRQRRARLKIVATADCDLEIYNGWYDS